MDQLGPESLENALGGLRPGSLENALGGLGDTLESLSGRAWRIFLEQLGKTLEEPPGTGFRIHVERQTS